MADRLPEAAAHSANSAQFEALAGALLQNQFVSFPVASLIYGTKGLTGNVGGYRSLERSRQNHRCRHHPVPGGYFTEHTRRRTIPEHQFPRLRP